jgi:hypothetical protein
LSPSYNLDLIKQALVEKWQDGENFYLLPYPSRRSGRGVNNPVTDFVLAFKNRVPDAVALALQIVTSSIARIESTLRDNLGCRYVVCIPGHRKGFANPAAEALWHSLSLQRKWFAFLPHALERTETVPKAAYARARGEPAPTYDDHIRTIKYNESALRKADGNFIMFDDVLTTSDTSQACRDIIKKATKCKRVIGVFLART